MKIKKFYIGFEYVNFQGKTQKAGRVFQATSSGAALEELDAVVSRVYKGYITKAEVFDVNDSTGEMALMVQTPQKEPKKAEKEPEKPINGAKIELWTTKFETGSNFPTLKLEDTNNAKDSV